MFLTFAGVLFVIFLLTIRHRNQLNSNDLGSMSTQWLADYNAEHP